jgi:hypothetical protein
MSRPEHDARDFVGIDFAPPRIHSSKRPALFVLLGVLLLVGAGLAVTQLLLH